MKTSTLFVRLALVVTAAPLLVLPQDAAAQLKVGVSIKLLYDNTHTNNFGQWVPVAPGAYLDTNGNIDISHCGNFTNSAISCDEEIEEKMEYVNGLMNRFGRGYQFELNEIVHLTNPPAIPPNELTNVSTRVWTHLNPDGAVQAALNREATKTNNWALYEYRTNAINIYVFHYDGGGFSVNGLRTDRNDVVTTSQSINGSWPRFLHELGHFLGLFHTFGRGSGTNEIPSDSVCDTLPDEGGSSQTLDGLAQLNFQTNFLSLNASEQEQIFDIYYNIMSYHADNGRPYDARLFDPDSIVAEGPTTDTNTTGKIRHRLTKDQLDRITNRFNYLTGRGIVSGRTVFVNPWYDPCPPVDSTNMNDCVTCDQAPRNPDGSVDTPLATITDGLAETGTDPNEDIVLIRAGTYGEALTINQPVTLRATRGDVIIAP